MTLKFTRNTRSVFAKAWENFKSSLMMMMSMGVAFELIRPHKNYTRLLGYVLQNGGPVFFHSPQYYYSGLIRDHISTSKRLIHASE